MCGSLRLQCARAQTGLGLNAASLALLSLTQRPRDTYLAGRRRPRRKSPTVSDQKAHCVVAFLPRVDAAWARILSLPLISQLWDLGTCYFAPLGPSLSPVKWG